MTTDSPAQPGFLSQFFAAPPRLAALLPDGRFFLRLVPVEPDSDAASVAEQVALALESLAPFPIAQLYHGHYWQPGSPRALVYAVYRKRFPAEETAAWGEAEIVVPAFVSLLADPPVPGVTRVLASPDAVTVFHWGDDALVPSHALIQPLTLDTDEAGRAAAREQLLRTVGADPATAEDWDYPVLHRVTDGGEVTFLSGTRPLVIPADLAAALDVRDNDEIAYRRGVQRRDIFLWRGCLGLAALVVLCTVAEGALLYGQSGQKKATNQIAADKQKVTALKATEDNTQNADQVLNRRLPSLELLSFVVQHSKPAGNFQFTRVAATLAKDGLPTLLITANTGSFEEYTNLPNVLRRLPEVKDVTTTQTPQTSGGGGGRAGGGLTNPNATPNYSFQFRITFNANAVPSDAPAPATAVVTAPTTR